jgi:hypothetical protein
MYRYDVPLYRSCLRTDRYADLAQCGGGMRGHLQQSTAPHRAGAPMPAGGCWAADQRVSLRYSLMCRIAARESPD